MGKGEELTTTKYLIHAQITANGIVEKPDVVGAVFGQTEGLLSNDLDLRELQRTGRIGRIQVNIHSNSGRAKGEIVIPSSLDRVETAILAASLETINRVGPCEAEIQTTKVEDVRAVKREQVVNRAKEIYKNMVESVGPTSIKMIEEVREAMRVHEISEYGEDRLPAGPAIHSSDAIIVVEGRSDVLNLLKYGIKNTVAVEGVSVPRSIGELSKKRTTTAFVDGDRGGELILKELLQIGDVDFITRAPKGKEVEDLEKDEVLVALRDKVPTAQFLATTNILNENPKKEHIKNRNNNRNNTKYDKKQKYNNNRREEQHVVDEPVIEDDEVSLMKDMLREFEGTGVGAILDEALNMTKEVEVENIYEEIKNIEGTADAVIFDGVISQRLVDAASEKGIKKLVAFKSVNIVKKPHNVKIITIN
ncbi:Toprim domain-containing protein [Methanobrevibacter gottschalkii]|uniref:DNA primase DnaG n=1 Tax=Methanobrevibacter gottschalkii TaxID=190974 RepID=A0A1H7KGV4_9EURY|nr:DNA primase DnaG [Methanobrevibacter gottschalkii]SEK85706.1 Toprim domain-containing protein [Methanobrevibacter gottschalkii]